MPRVIEIVKSEEKSFVHKQCGAKVGYYINEVQDGGIHHDYGGGSERWYYIVCPNCGQRVEVRKY